MRTTGNYLIIMFSIMLFVFRLIVVFTATMGMEFILEPINVNYEMALLFVMIISIILMSKNKLSGAIILIIASIVYYGPDLLNQITYLPSGATQEVIVQVIISAISLIIPIFAFFIIAFAKEQEVSPVNRKTDIFYKTDAYDRQYDDRADRNNYRIM